MNNSIYTLDTFTKINMIYISPTSWITWILDNFHYQFVQFHMEKREKKEDLRLRVVAIVTDLLWAALAWNHSRRGAQERDTVSQIKASLFPPSPRDASLETQRSGRGWPWFERDRSRGEGQASWKSRDLETTPKVVAIFSLLVFESFDTLFEGWKRCFFCITRE